MMWRPGLAGWIIVGVLAGVATGLFFGEYAAGLAILGDAFVGLLQMTVLPYITFSLIANIGGLPQGNSRRLALAVAGFLLISWVAVLAAIVMMPLVLPPLESASFFSTSLLTPPTEMDFVSLFIPANPFHALANNVVPAVVLFCICVGAALMTLPNRRKIVDALDLLTSALGRVNGFLVRLTPLGVFAIAASTAGTMQPEEFERLQVYLLIYTVATLLLGLVVLPGLVTSLTPFTYRQVMTALRIPLVTAFATGKVFIVLPMLIDQAEKIFAELDGERDERDERDERNQVIRAVTPLVYPFPHAGKLMALMFIPFTAWFVDQPLGAVDYPVFLGAGLLSFFGSPTAAMPFLLDLHELPSDMFQLFIVSGIYGARLGDALGAVHILFITVLTTAAMSGLLRRRLRRLAFFLVATTLLWGGVLAGCRAFLGSAINDSYTQDTLLTEMESRVAPGPVTILANAAPDTVLDDLAIMARVRQTGVLRVGYQPQNLPWSFRNARDELVGYDVDMALRLAEVLRCELEFVPADFWNIRRDLEQGLYDVRMSGAVMLPSMLEAVLFSDPYMTLTAALIVRDHDRESVTERVRRRDFEGFRLGRMPQVDSGRIFVHLLPGHETVYFESITEYLATGGAEADGWLWAAESGSAWTLLYPAFSVVPLEPLYRIPVGYCVALDQGEFSEVLNNWLAVMEANGERQQLYDYWVLGRDIRKASRRWSVLEDVLGRGD